MPRWRWPERCAYELNALQEIIGTNLTYDEDALTQGTLVIRFDWPVEGRTISLEAIYPDSFPRTRPIVRLLTRPFPERHCSPTDGTLCLLGRDTRQWTPETTLRELLEKQLEHALNGTGTEDPQGEPMEFWWNSQSLANSYCLIESDWTIGAAESGSLTLHGQVDWEGRIPLVRAAVIEVANDSADVLARYNNKLPSTLDTAAKTITVPWVRVHGPLSPADDRRQLYELMAARPNLLKQRSIPLSLTKHCIIFGVVYDTELTMDAKGLGWLFPVLFGTPKRIRDLSSGGSLPMGVVRTLRAGPIDMGVRVPATQCLREKTVAVFGLGALGAPLAIELARNGCRRLHLIDYDIVEPGNGIRWPLGATAWGNLKSEALMNYINREYPWTEVIPHNHHIGLVGGPDHASGDAKLFAEALTSVDLAIDATASDGATDIIWDNCEDHRIPMITLFASPNLEGGLVARFGLDGGCPLCLKKEWATKSIKKPRGLDVETELHQPPGCSERTFTGASYDLQEISLQAMRLAVETLSDDNAARASTLYTLALANDEGRIPPNWEVCPLTRTRDCPCSPQP